MSSFPRPLICFLLLSAIYLHVAIREASSQSTDAAKDTVGRRQRVLFLRSRRATSGHSGDPASGILTGNKYPLFVQLFGSANLLPTRERRVIRVRPSGRGVCDDRSVSRYDILQVIRRTKEAYQIDLSTESATGRLPSTMSKFRFRSSRQ